MPPQSLRNSTYHSIIILFVLTCLLIIHGPYTFPFTQRSSSLNFKSHTLDSTNSTDIGPNEILHSTTGTINGTLGFQKIFAINLPSRTDRRDTLTLMSIYNGIQIEWLDGVRGSDMDPKAWPPHWDPDRGSRDFNLGQLGSWRSHLNVLRHIVENRYTSALILEDDADWDIAIRSQLALLAENLRLLPASDTLSLAQSSAEEPPASVYGSSWDVLWLGSCANPPAPPGAVIYQDPVTQRTSYLWDIPGGAACSLAYAVTYESAKALYQHMLDCKGPYDLRLSDFCKSHNCPLIWPTLMAHHVPAGSGVKVSDIDLQSDEAKESFREIASTPGIDHSAILEMLDGNAQTGEIEKTGKTA